ncbi:MAG: hypothetical protein Q9213_000706 [Squamulea squamosa]
MSKEKAAHENWGIQWRSQKVLKELVKRDRPMKVLIMGMPRSGTMFTESYANHFLSNEALVAALRQLGYTPYDFIDRLILGHMALWTQALRAKFLGQSKPWGKAELDRVVKGFDVRSSDQDVPSIPHPTCVLDVPCPFFTEEFLAAYPESVVILNKRDPESWLASMNSTLFRVFSWNSWPLIAKLDPGFAGVWYTHCMLTWDIFCGNDYGEKCKQKYLEHYDYVRRVTPKERLLEYDVKEGWEPLCRFLRKEIPNGDFPNVNDTETFLKGHGILWAYALFKVVRNVAIGAMSVGVGVAAWWFYRKRSATD